MTNETKEIEPSRDDLQTSAHEEILDAMRRVEKQVHNVEDAIHADNSTLARLKHAIELHMATEELIERLVAYRKYRP
jgi:hypothetical protein